MRMGKLLVAVAASALVATPVMAKEVAAVGANQASSLSIAKAVDVKARTSAKKSNKLAPEAGVVIGLVVVGGTIAIVAADDSDSN